jgi:integrase
MKDLDPQRGQLTVRGGKGDKDRYVMMPLRLKERLQQQMAWRRQEGRGECHWLSHPRGTHILVPCSFSAQ